MRTTIRCDERSPIELAPGAGRRSRFVCRSGRSHHDISDSRVAARWGAGLIFVLDLSRLSFIDSSGVHITTGLVKRAMRLNIGLMIVPGSTAVQRIFEICELTERLPFTART